MPLVLQTDTNPGAATWGALAAGAVQSIQQRVQLSDMPASNSNLFTFADAVPANSLVVGASYFITASPAGGATTQLDFIFLLLDPPTGLIFAETDIFGASTGWPVTSPTPTDQTRTAAILTGAQQPVSNATAPQFALTTDGPNLDTLTAIDFTAYVFYLPLEGYTAPPI